MFCLCWPAAGREFSRKVSGVFNHRGCIDRGLPPDIAIHKKKKTFRNEIQAKNFFIHFSLVSTDFYVASTSSLRIGLAGQIEYFKRIQGVSDEDLIARVMKNFMTNALAKTFSMDGQRGKTAFKITESFGILKCKNAILK